MNSILLQRHNEIPIQYYLNMMYEELNLLDEERLITLENIIHQKEKVAKHYTKKVKRIFLN